MGGDGTLVPQSHVLGSNSWTSTLCSWVRYYFHDVCTMHEVASPIFALSSYAMLKRSQEFGLSRRIFVQGQSDLVGQRMVPSFRPPGTRDSKVLRALSINTLFLIGDKKHCQSTRLQRTIR